MGKSTLVKLFSQNNGLDLIEINLEKTKLSFVAMFPHPGALR